MTPTSIITMPKTTPRALASFVIGVMALVRVTNTARTKEPARPVTRKAITVAPLNSYAHEKTNEPLDTRAGHMQHEDFDNIAFIRYLRHYSPRSRASVG